MAVDLFATHKQALELMRAGKVQEADDLLSKVITAAPAADGGGAGAAAEPAPPRSPQTIIHALLTAIVGHLGNHPALIALLEELGAALNL